MNLLEETLSVLKRINKTLDDIEYIYVVKMSWNSNNVLISSKAWQPELLDFEYDKGYGSQSIDGWITFTDNTWLSRAEYDGSEWWEYHEKPGPEDLI